MQNTSKIPNIPNTLVKNFFIAGVNQKTLASKILEKKATEIPPEVLFSMYQSKERFVFPEKIAVEYSSIEPKFFTFMTTDQEGFNTYIHVLIFYEEVNEAEISRNDFDILTEILRKQHLNKKEPNRNQKSITREGSNGTIQQNGADSYGTLFNQHRKKIQEKFKQRNEAVPQLNAAEISTLHDMVEVTKETKIFSAIPKTPHANVNNMLQNFKDDKTKNHRMKEQETKDKMEKLKSKINIHGFQNNALLSNQSQSDYRAASSYIQGTATNKNITDNSVTLTIRAEETKSYTFQSLVNEQKIQQQKTQLSNFPQFLTEEQSLPKSQLYLRPKSNAIKVVDSSADRYSMQINDNDRNIYEDTAGLPSSTIKSSYQVKVLPKGYDDYYGMNRSNPIPTFGGAAQHQEDPYCRISDDSEEDFDDDFVKQNNLFLDRHTSNFGKRQSIMISEQDDKLEYLYEKKSYVPVALCLETETEYHDIFRKILLTLFDEIRVPDDVLSNKIFENRRLAFAELVAHLAFLRSIPAPSFNSVYNIFLFNKLFTIKENTIDQLPNKNTYAIKILFDVLDVKSIFYCWKALLFDKSLVLVSSQYSLQFYVAEALKQLLFPLTWQNTYIQPGNENLAGHCDGTIVCLYGSNSVKIGFDFFEEMSPEMAVVDIDACYTNNIELPMIPDETMYIRLLNLLKNSRVSQYDKAYPDTHMPESDDFVNQVREAFFGVLKPFLSRVEHYIDKSVESSQAYFQKYFNHAQFLDDFSDYGEIHYRFAKELIQSSQFVHFCDDYFNDELNNYKVLKAIFRSRGELNDDQDDTNKVKMPNIFDSVSPDDVKVLNFNKIWPEMEPIVFNFRMPNDDQRFMLFEKILFMNEESLAKREKMVSRETNEHIIQNKDNLMYDQIIRDIKKMYPIKLKGIHNKYHDQNMKLLQQNLKRRQQALESTKNNNGLKKLPTFFKNNENGYKYRPSLDASQLVIDINNVNMRSRGSMRVTELDSRFQALINGAQKNQKENSASKLQLDLVSNDEFNGSSTVINNNSFIELEYQRIKNCKRRISRLMYGKQGLMTFLHHIFGLLSEQQMKRVNYYFALKDQLRKMMEVEKKLSEKNKEDKMNITIKEESDDENGGKSSESSNQLANSSTRDRTKTQNQNPRQRKLPTKSPISQMNFDQVRKQRTNTNLKSSLNGQSAIKSVSSAISSIFKDKSEWFKIENWMYHGCAIKRTQQFILFKIKMYETFECPDDGYSCIWRDLLKFPGHQMEFFPLSKFMHIWQNLTQSQQEEQFIKLGQKQNKPFIQQICQDFIKQNKMRDQTQVTNDHQMQVQQPEKHNDENIFREVSIDKNWISYRQEKKDKEQQLRQKLMSQKSSIFSQTSVKLHTHTQPDQKQLKKKNSKTDMRSGTNVSDMLKQKLENRRNPSSAVSTKKESSLDQQDRTMYSQSGRSFFSEIEGMFNMKYTSGAESSRNDLSMSKQDSLSILIDYNLGKNKINREPTTPYQKMSNPEKVSQNLLLKIVKFWENNSKFIEKKGQFKESELTRIQEELKVYDKYFDYLRDYQPEVNTEIEKQVFFLNIYNFLVMYYIALYMFSNPDVIPRIQNYNMWQAFLINCKVKIGSLKINAFTIKHSILRFKLQQPNISEFMLQTPQIEFQCLRFQIQKPDPLISFGFFIPLKKSPRLKVFNTMDFQEQLRSRAEEFILKKLRIKQDSRFLFIPKYLDMYQKDFGQQNFIDLLKFIDQHIYQSGGHSDVARFLNELDQSDFEKEKVIIESREYCWQFNPQRMAKLFYRPPTPTLAPVSISIPQ